MNDAAAPRPLALAPLLISVVCAAWFVPAAAWTTLREPSSRATLAMLLVVPALLALRRRGERGAQRERALLCIFLACMPWIYLESGLRHDGGPWLFVEALGQAVFALWAWLAYERSAWWLAAGLLSHGVLWDSWHHDSSYIASWYAVACLIVDAGLAAYVAIDRDRLSPTSRA